MYLGKYYRDPGMFERSSRDYKGRKEKLVKSGSDHHRDRERTGP